MKSHSNPFRKILSTTLRQRAAATLLLLLTAATSRAATVNVDVDPANAFHQFVPGDVTINPGDTVVWTWRGDFHSVTSGDPGSGVQSGLFNTNVHNSGFTFSFTFPDPGTYSYFCIPHREMGISGNVIVNEATTQLANISTRLAVQTGDNALIGGFIVTGPAPKKVIVRGIGPSLTVPGKLANTTLELFGPSGLLMSNDDWRTTQEAEIIASTVPQPTTSNRPSSPPCLRTELATPRSFAGRTIAPASEWLRSTISSAPPIRSSRTSPAAGSCRRTIT